MGIPLCVICCFSLAAFNIWSLCLTFVNLINMCLGMFYLGFILFGTLWVSQTWLFISFNLFFFFPLCFIYFYHFIFYLTYPIFCLCYSTVGSLQSVFDLIYCIT